QPPRPADGRPVRGQAVDDDAERFEGLDDLFDVAEMPINLDLLRRIVLEPHRATLDGGLQIDAKRLGVADHLGGRLVEAEHDASLAAARAFGEVLQRHDALADAGNADYERGAAEEITAVDEIIEAGHAGRNSRVGIERCGAFAVHVARRLDTAVDLDAAS